jgi:hypothetical protein
MGMRVSVVAVDNVEVGDTTAVIVENTPLMAELDAAALPGDKMADDESAVIVELEAAAAED